jgi:hypothetical protein
MHRRDISKALFASAAGSTLVAQRAEAQSCVAPCYARTAAETAPPTNLAYPPGHVYRYGTNTTPGTTDMTSAINTCADVCRLGYYTLQLPGETCLVSGSLNFSGIEVIGAGSIFRGLTHIKANSSQFDVITSTGGMVLFNVSVHGGWDGVAAGLSGDILSIKAAASAHPYLVGIMYCSFVYAKKRAIYIERGGYTDIYHTQCLAAGLHSLEVFGTSTDMVTTVRTYGSCQFGATPNGFGIKLTEAANCTFRDAILEDTQGIQLNGNDNRAIAFDGCYQENTSGGLFITDNGSAGIGLAVRSCFGGNTSIPFLTNWLDVSFSGNSNLASGAIPFANRIFQNDGGQGIVSGTGDLTTASLTLSAGTYLVFGTVQTVVNSGSGNITQLACAVTTNASDSGLANTTFPFVVGADQQTYTPLSGISDLRVNCFTVLQVTTPTTCYLRAHIAIAGSVAIGYHGFLNAVLMQ